MPPVFLSGQAAVAPSTSLALTTPAAVQAPDFRHQVAYAGALANAHLRAVAEATSNACASITTPAQIVARAASLSSANAHLTAAPQISGHAHGQSSTSLQLSTGKATPIPRTRRRSRKLSDLGTYVGVMALGGTTAYGIFPKPETSPAGSLVAALLLWMRDRFL